MKRNEVNKMINGIDDRFISEAIQENTVKKSNGKGKKIAVIGSIAACMCLIASSVYLTGKPDKAQIGVCISHDGVNMFYEQEELIRLKDFMLKNEKGEKIDEFSADTVSWYKLKDSDGLKTIIRDDGKDITEWRFVSYSFDDNDDKNMKWIAENVFAIGSIDDIKNITINDEERELNDGQKEKLYNYILALKNAQSDEEMSLLEGIYGSSETVKLSVCTPKDTVEFLLYPNENVLQLNEGKVYALFTVMTDDEFSNMR